MIKEIIERNREEVDEIKKIYNDLKCNLQKKIRKEEDCLKACIKRQMITSNAKEGGNVYQILRHAK